MQKRPAEVVSSEAETLQQVSLSGVSMVPHTPGPPEETAVNRTLFLPGSSADPKHGVDLRRRLSQSYQYTRTPWSVGSWGCRRGQRVGSGGHGGPVRSENSPLLKRPQMRAEDRRVPTPCQLRIRSNVICDILYGVKASRCGISCHCEAQIW